LVRLFSDSFSVRDDGVTLLEVAFCVFFFKILKANFDVEFTAASNNVLTRLFSGANDKRVRFGELAKTFDELRKIRGVLDFDGNTHDR